MPFYSLNPSIPSARWLRWISKPGTEKHLSGFWHMVLPTSTRWQSTTSDSVPRKDPVPFYEDLLTGKEIPWGCLVLIIGGSWPPVGRDALMLRGWMLYGIFWKDYMFKVTANHEWLISLPGLLGISLEHLSSHQKRWHTHRHISQPC